MTTLYNCRHDGDQYRISKFDEHLNVESSYLLTLTECECPAGHRPTCRHRQMLPKFLQRKAVNTDYFYDHDRGGWVQMATQPPDGIVMFTLTPANIGEVYNAIADAVGEPPLSVSKPEPTPAPAKPNGPIPFNRRGL